MKLFLKIFLGLFLLFIIAITAAVLLFDPNDYKPQIITLFKDNTGRDLSIPGRISLSVFPWIGLELGKIEISNAPGFGKVPFAKMSHLQVRAKLWPLFKKRLEADTLVVDGLTLNLEKNKQGINNWDDLAQAGKPAAAGKKGKAKAETEKTTGTALAAFAVNGIELSHAQLNWNDQQQKQKMLISDIQLKVGQLRPASRIPLETQFHFQQKDLDAKINLQSQVVFSADFQQFSLYDTRLKTELKMASLKQTQSPRLSSPEIQLDLKKQTAQGKRLVLSAGNLELETGFAAQHIMTTPQFSGQFNIKSFNPKVTATGFGISLPALADEKALTQLAAQFDLAGSLEKVKLSKLKIKLDDTNINGHATLKLTPLDSDLNIAIDAINLDRYLPKPDASKKKETAPSTSQTAEAALIPVALLSKLNAHAVVTVNQFQIMKTHWSKLQLVANAKSHAGQGTVDLKPLTVSGYGATVNAAVNLQAKNTHATVAANVDMHNLKSGQLLKDYMGVDKLKGLASVKANITSQGTKLSQLKQNLNGKLQLSLHDGIITGFDLNHQRQSLEAKLKGKQAPPAPQPVQTEFAELTASARIKNGVVTNNDLRAATPFTRVAGQGSVDLPREQLHYVVSTKFTNSSDVKNNVPYEKMNAIPLDTVISGPFAKPEIKIDFQKALSEIAKKELKVQERKLKAKAQKQLDQEVERKKQELKEKLGNDLKKLFKF